MKEKKFFLKDYKGKKVVFKLNKIEDIIALYLMEISGDEVLEVLYKNGETKYYDSGAEIRFMHYWDGGYFTELEDFLKEHELTDLSKRSKQWNFNKNLIF